MRKFFSNAEAWLLQRAAGMATAKRRYRAYDALSSLDDRTLRDLGLDRTMLLSVAVRGARNLKDAALPAS